MAWPVWPALLAVVLGRAQEVGERQKLVCPLTVPVRGAFVVCQCHGPRAAFLTKFEPSAWFGSLEVTQSGFDPDCLPTEIRDFSDVGEVGKETWPEPGSKKHLRAVQEPPYIYLQWMLAETCGVHLAEFKTQFATLPQVLSRGLGISRQ